MIRARTSLHREFAGSLAVHMTISMSPTETMIIGTTTTTTTTTKRRKP